MGMRFTPKWRAYLRQPSWFSRGWMKSGAYVVLYTPSETAELVALWAEFADRRGMLPIGNDGAGENLTIDARETRTAVTLTPGVSTGWEDSVVQHGSIAEFITAIEARTFDFKFGVE